MLPNSNCEEKKHLKTKKGHKTQMAPNLRTQIKYKNVNCDKTQKLTLCKKHKF